MRKLILRDVRCFRDVAVQLAPLTLLVGENSTGKSSFLALLRLAWDLAAGRADLDFNEEPFQLGAYDHIAHDSGTDEGPASRFTIGLEWSEREQAEMRVEGTFHPRAGQPAPVRIDLTSPGVWAAVELEDERRDRARVRVGNRALEVSAGWDLQGSDWITAFRMAGRHIAVETESPELHQVMDRLTRVGARLELAERPFASAPVRTAPRRTYDPVRETRQAAGEHIPMLLARLAGTDKREWRRISKAIVRFGHACGLLDGLDVHRASKRKSDPFQIHVEIEGLPRAVNLVDVGYGVSQVLPVLVDALVAQPGAWLLLQQPEVHLHPRAQAEVGTILGELVTTGRNFVVETHSDYLIDRVCMDVRDGRGLEPDQVVILYFERKGAAVEVHPIRVGADGVPIDPPAGYRDFFRREQLRHLGIVENAG